MSSVTSSYIFLKIFLGILTLILSYTNIHFTWAGPEGGQGSGPPPRLITNHKSIGFLSNTGPDPLKNHKATKPALNVGPSSARKRNAI